MSTPESRVETTPLEANELTVSQREKSLVNECRIAKRTDIYSPHNVSPQKLGYSFGLPSLAYTQHFSIEKNSALLFLCDSHSHP